MTTVFLGGTCPLRPDGTTWRNDLIPMLNSNIDAFNPVVKDWDDAAYKLELEKRETCDYCLYVITPNIEGFYSFAEVVDDSNKRPNKTIFCYLDLDVNDCYEETTFNDKQMKSLDAIGKMVVNNGGKWFKSLSEIAQFFNRLNETNNG